MPISGVRRAPSTNMSESFMDETNEQEQQYNQNSLNPNHTASHANLNNEQNTMASIQKQSHIQDVVKPQLSRSTFMSTVNEFKQTNRQATASQSKNVKTKTQNRSSMSLRKKS
jgi:hypothetical protein